MATLVAIPVLFFSGGSSVELDASAAMTGMTLDAGGDDEPEVATTEAEATASSLLDTIDRNGLLDGGADPAAALKLQVADEAELSTTIVVPGTQAPTTASPSSGSSASPAVSAAESTRVPTVSETTQTTSAPSTSPTTATPTTAAPTTAAPTTAAPTTAAPTTAAPTTAAPTTAAPTTSPPATDAPEPVDEPEPEADEPSSSGPSAADWEALRQCESFGSYTIQSSNGLYYGAYQFGIGTWNATAASVGRDDLVGVLPSDASPADQDAMALALWNQRGWSPWPHCGRGLG